MADEYQLPMDYQDEVNPEETDKTETEVKTEKERVVDFFTSIPEEDSKRIRDYLKEHPKIDISVEDLSSLNKVLKQTNFQSESQKATLSLEERLEKAQTMEEKEKILEAEGLYQNPQFGHSKIKPATPLPPPLTEKDFEDALAKDENYQQDKKYWLEKKAEISENSKPKPNIKFG